MGKGRAGFVALFLSIAGLMAGAQTSTRDDVKRAQHLSDIIESVNLTDGVETIGGASIRDAVNLLRDRVAFPVAFEMIEFDRERPKDFVTLDEALRKLHSMQAAGSLSADDKSRLNFYEELAKTHPGSEVLLPRQKTFTLVRDRITVRDLLDQVTTLDDEYRWKNYGTESPPNIVIEPTGGSALSFPVPSICEGSVVIDQVLAGCIGQECGQFMGAVGERNIYIMYGYEGPGPMPDLVPHGLVDLCDTSLTARDALNRIAEAANTSWTLGGIKGIRFLSFSPR